MQPNRHSRASTDENMLLFSMRDRLSEDSKPIHTRDSSFSSTNSQVNTKNNANQQFDAQDFESFSEDATLVQAAQQSPFIPPADVSTKLTSKQSDLRRQGINLFWILAWYVFFSDGRDPEKMKPYRHSSCYLISLGTWYGSYLDFLPFFFFFS